MAYYRVSTKKQGASHLSLDAQREAVLKYIKNNGNRIIKEYTEVESGKNDDRPELNKALHLCRQEGAVLVVAKLDRLYRNVYFTTRLMNDKVKFICVDFPEASDLTIHIFAAIAEWERKEISRRTKAALAKKYAKDPASRQRHGLMKDGTRAFSAEGRAKGARRIRYKANTNIASRHAFHFIRPLREQGLSFAKIASKLNEEGYETRYGKKFYASQVRNIWERFNNEN